MPARESRTRTTGSTRFMLRANLRPGRPHRTGTVHAQWCPALALPNSCRRELAANMETAIAIRVGRNPPSGDGLEVLRRRLIERDASTAARTSPGCARLRRTDRE